MIILLSLLVLLLPTYPIYTDIETAIRSRDFFIYSTEASYILYCVKTAKTFMRRDSTIVKVVLRFEASWQPRLGHWGKEERVNCAFYIYKLKTIFQTRHWGTGK